MILKKANKDAIRYAILKWHYSKSVPSVKHGYAVFNSDGVFCGVICYSNGANCNIAKPFNLVQGQVLELVRVALNGKQGQGMTSKALALSLRLLKKDNPLVKVVVSYADEEQGHNGGIYQATNWIFVGDSVGKVPIRNGKRVHKRTYSSAYGSYSNVPMVQTMPKHKYLFIYDKTLRKTWEVKALPYPKKKSCGSGVDGSTASFQDEGDVQVDPVALTKQNEACNGP